MAAIPVMTQDNIAINGHNSRKRSKCALSIM